MKRLIMGAVAGSMGLAALVAWTIAGRDLRSAQEPEGRPPLALLTSLPLVFGERFGLENGGSPTLRRLEQYYRVQPIGVADTASLNGQQLLLMAHPRAQPADVLVELDKWVRDGGRLLLLADPKLDWPSERPLGDRLRPPPAFADTGLLGHWGMQLSAPEEAGPVMATNGRIEIMASSPGRLDSRSCEITGRGFVARCRIGRGLVTTIADADFLNVEGEGALDGPTDRNLDLLVDELALLESR